MSAAPRATAAEARAEADEILAEVVKRTQWTAQRYPGLAEDHVVRSALRYVSALATVAVRHQDDHSPREAANRAGILMAMSELDDRVRAAWAEARQ